MQRIAGEWDVAAARDAVPPAVFFDLASDVTVVDVSTWGEPVDMDLLGAVGDPVLVCFGSHGDNRCPLRITGRHHGVVIDTVDGRPGHVAFVDQFRKLVRPDVPIRTRARDTDPEVEKEI